MYTGRMEVQATPESPSSFSVSNLPCTAQDGQAQAKRSGYRADDACPACHAPCGQLGDLNEAACSTTWMHLLLMGLPVPVSKGQLRP